MCLATCLAYLLVGWSGSEGVDGGDGGGGGGDGADSGDADAEAAFTQAWARAQKEEKWAWRRHTNGNTDDYIMATTPAVLKHIQLARVAR